MPFIPFMIVGLILALIWEKVPWLFLIVLLMFGTYFYLTLQGTRTKIMRANLVRQRLSNAREEFLLCAFGITRSDCEFLSFDGRYFHHSVEVPYEQYSSIRDVGASIQNVTDPSLPHIFSWKFQRVDGGPDLRYRNNSTTMHSECHNIEFYGRQTFNLPVFCYPAAKNVDFIIPKFQTFLFGAQPLNYEELFEKYQTTFKARSAAEVELAGVEAKLRECNLVLEAVLKLSTVKNTILSLEQKVADATLQNTENRQRADELRQKIAELLSLERLVINDTKQQYEMAALRETIGNFS